MCDIGAGVAHLTLPMAEYGCIVDSMEPNDAMSANGQARTTRFPGVTWYEGTGEETGRPSGVYDFVTFGSSFNVCDRQRAMVETCRLLKPRRYFACMSKRGAPTLPCIGKRAVPFTRSLTKSNCS